MANSRAPGGCFVLVFSILLILAEKWPGIPDFVKTIFALCDELLSCCWALVLRQSLTTYDYHL